MASPSSEPPSLPEAEPKVQSDIRPEPEVEIEAEIESTIEPEDEPMAEGGGFIGLRPWYLRPDPNWKHLEERLGVFWPLHVYFIGACFLLLAVVAVYHIIRISRMKRSLGKPYYISLHCMLVICGVTRAVHFFADPYHSRRYLPLAISFITLHTHDPCMLSAFILIFITLFKVTRIRVVTHGLFNPIQIITVMVVSFLMTLSSDIIVAYVKGTMLYMFLCQVYFVVWGLFSSGLYGYLFCRVFNRLFMTRVKINRMSRLKSSRRRKPEGKDPEKGEISSSVYTLKDTVGSPGSERPLLDDSDCGKAVPTAECKQSMDIVCDISSTGTAFNTEMTEVTNHSTSSLVVVQEYGTNTSPKTRSDSSIVNSSKKQELLPKKSLRRQLFDFKNPDDIVEAKVPLVAKLVLAAALVFLLLSSCSLLSIIMGAARIGEDARGSARPWFWWGYQTTMRLLEISLAAIIVVIGAAPLYSKTKTPSDK